MTLTPSLRRWIAPAALCLSLAAPGLAFAQQPAPQQRGEGRMGRHRGERMEERLAMMTQRLGLSADQQTRIRALFQQHRAQRQAMRQQQTAPTPEQRREMMRARFAMHDQIDAILTPQQRAQMREMHRERMMERAERGGGWHGRGGRGRGHHRGRGGRGGRGVPPGAV